jgi:hypothetical protein
MQFLPNSQSKMLPDKRRLDREGSCPCIQQQCNVLGDRVRGPDRTCLVGIQCVLQCSINKIGVVLFKGVRDRNTTSQKLCFVWVNLAAGLSLVQMAQCFHGLGHGFGAARYVEIPPSILVKLTLLLQN